MPTINIQINGLDKLKVALIASPRVVEDEMNKGIKRAVLSLERVAKQLVPVDTGKLRASHTSEFSNMRGELYPATTYAAAVHEGTKAHFPPIGTPGVGLWATKRGMSPYALAKSISRHGTQGTPWLAATANQEERNVENILQLAVDRALKRIFG